MSVVNIGAIRLAFVLLFRRIFRGTIFTIVNWTLIGIIIGWTIAFFLALLLQCGSHFSETYGQYCSTSFDIMAAMGVTDVIIDLAILVLPIGPIKQLNMDTKRKLGLLAIFSLGVTRMIFLMEIVAYSKSLQSLGITDARSLTLPQKTTARIVCSVWIQNPPQSVSFQQHLESVQRTVEELIVIVDIEMVVDVSIVRWRPQKDRRRRESNHSNELCEVCDFSHIRVSPRPLESSGEGNWRFFVGTGAAWALMTDATLVTSPGVWLRRVMLMTESDEPCLPYMYLSRNYRRDSRRTGSNAALPAAPCTISMRRQDDLQVLVKLHKQWSHPGGPSSRTDLSAL
nr:hypothetical protein CFP56_28564 [Quercus suber]